jgi:RNA polymerase sigma-70 factor (ECF subfamily)
MDVDITTEPLGQGSDGQDVFLRDIWPSPREVQAVIDGVIAELPPQQRQVITLRDVIGCDAEETCNALGLTEVNQRVLLHRARSRVRRALERYMEGE